MNARSAPAGRRRPRRTAVPVLPEVIVFVIAFAIRLSEIVTSGGLRGNYGYDASVYYSAADALTFGRLPYRDFVLLHPPAIMLALTPFATLGRLTSDQTGFAAGNLAFIALGAVNAVLVMRVARRWDLGRRAALAGGLFYAVWFGAIDAEYLSRLEPLGNFLMLGGLLALAAARRSSSRLIPLLAGLGFGAAACTKIWWIVPLLVVLAWHLPRSRRRSLGGLIIGAAVALVAIDGPFFAAAPSAMWRMVVVEQIRRPTNRGAPLTRLNQATGLHAILPHAPMAIVTALSGLIVLVVMAALVMAWRLRAARLVVVIGGAQGLVLLIAPSWFSFYADFLAPATALGLAAAVAVAARDRSGRALRTDDPAAAEPDRAAAEPRSEPARVASSVRAVPWAALAVTVAITVDFLAGGHSHATSAFPDRRLAEAVEATHCTMSDSPMGLILLDSLSRDLRDGCPNWVDVTGRTYGVDAPTRRGLSRLANAKWQRDLLGYLRSGNAVFIVRRGGAGVSSATMRALARGGVLAREDGHVIYRTNRNPF